MRDAPPAVVGRRAGIRRPRPCRRAVAGAVPGDAEHRRRDRVLGHAGDDVRQMMLHRRSPAGRIVGGRAAGGVVGMQIARDEPRPHARRAGTMSSAARGVRLARRGGLQIADMLAQRRRRHRAVSATVVFRWPPSARMPGAKAVDGDRRGRIAARAAQHQRPAADDARHGIVDRPHDRPVVDQEADRRCRPSRASASRSSVAIGSSERLPLVATTGKAKLAQQQMMQRRIGQHRAEPRIARRDGLARSRRRRGAAARSAAAGRRAAPPRSGDTRSSRACPRARETSPRRAFPAGACAVRRRRTAVSLRASTIR